MRRPACEAFRLCCVSLMRRLASSLHQLLEHTKTHISDRNATTGNEDELHKSPPDPATREMLPVPEKPCLANKTSPSNFFSRRLFDENDEMHVSEEEGPTASDPAGWIKCR